MPCVSARPRVGLARVCPAAQAQRDDMPEPTQPMVFALTGGIGAGKSTVASAFEGLGVPFVRADELAREVVLPGSAGLREIEATFGSGVLQANGELDRGKLGHIVFAEPEKRAALNLILHPRIAELASARFAELGRRGHRLVGYEIPLVIETGQVERYRPLVVVTAELPERIARVQARDGLTPEAIEARIRAQASDAERLAQADFVVDNAGPPGPLRERLAALIPELAAFRPRAGCS
jgi:dephospho-CoA kinase